MIEETLAFNGHNPVKSQILQWIWSTTYWFTGCYPSRGFTTFLLGIPPQGNPSLRMVDQLIKPEALKLLEGEKNEVPNGEFMDHVVRSSNNQFCTHTYIYTYSLCNFPALKSNMDLENRRLEKEIPFGRHFSCRSPVGRSNLLLWICRWKGPPGSLVHC